MRNLLDFLKEYYHWLLFVVLEVVSGFLLLQYNNYQASVWFSSANSMMGKVLEWSSRATKFIHQSQANEQLTMRNLLLEQQVDMLRRRYAELTYDSTVMERNETKFLSQYDLIPAKVIDNSLDSKENLMTIDKGRADGVTVDMGVACGRGVVGVVYLVSEHYSVVIPVLNASSSRISCAIRNRGYFGYLHWYGGDPSVAYVEDVPRHAKFKLGEWVVTSGFSSIFPSGVSVGKIEQVYNSRDGLSYKLKIRLSTDFSSLRDVVVISDKSIAERAALLQAARDSINKISGER
jgi:rod shape-determining protein MreC